MSTHLTEQEQLEMLKNWWKDYGKSVIAAVITAIVIYFAWTSWQEHKAAKAEAASATYEALVKILGGGQAKALSDADKASAEHFITDLKDKNSRSFYAVGAAMLSAKMAVDKGDLDKAVTELKYVLNAKPDDATRQIVQLRLARVYIAKKSFADAEAQLTGEVSKAFAAEFSEVRGDLLNAKEDKAGALTAYQKALSELGADQQRTMIVQMKVDALKTPETALSASDMKAPVAEKAQ